MRRCLLRGTRATARHRRLARHKRNASAGVRQTREHLVHELGTAPQHRIVEHAHEPCQRRALHRKLQLRLRLVQVSRVGHSGRLPAVVQRWVIAIKKKESITNCQHYQLLLYLVVGIIN